MSKTIEVKYIDTTPVTCTIDYERDCESPREWDNLGVMVLSHKRYDVPNEIELSFEDFDGWDEVEKHLRKEHDACIVLPVQMYDHSGVSIYVGDTHDRWDGGQLGFIFATKERVREWHGVKRITKELLADVEQTLRGEVEMYSKYANGEMYRFTLEDNRGEILDACGGYFDTDDILSELKQYENITFAGEVAI